MGRQEFRSGAVGSALPAQSSHGLKVFSVLIGHAPRHGVPPACVWLLYDIADGSRAHGGRRAGAHGRTDREGSGFTGHERERTDFSPARGSTPPVGRTSSVRARRDRRTLALGDPGSVLLKEGDDRVSGVEHLLAVHRAERRLQLRQLCDRDRLREVLVRLLLRVDAVADPNQIHAVAAQLLDLALSPPQVVPSDCGDQVGEVVPEPGQDLA